MEKLNGILEALISRGYSREDVIKLSSYTDEDFNCLVDIAFDRISEDVVPVKNPVALFIGGQPGCGKSCLSMKIKKEYSNVVEIGIDNYRMYHPNYLKMEKLIKEHWKNRKETINDTPGNDIADFTHLFAGAMTDAMIEKTSKKMLLINFIIFY